jgi:DNA mismatch repair protein MutS2
VDEHSIQLLEFDRVAHAIAAHAESEAARRRLESWRPLEAPETRQEETELLREAMGRHTEPGAWCAVGRGALADRLDPRDGSGLDAMGLLDVSTWLDASGATRAAWADDEKAGRYPRLAAHARALPDLSRLLQRLQTALEPDGRVSDAASPVLRKARAELATGERRIQERLERWAREFGDESYVTRRGDRFVTLVPAAGFSRRTALVHDVSGSGQSLFVEPLEACEANNRLIELRGRVQQEEHRVILELAQQVRRATPELEGVEATLVRFDTLRARARWGGEIGGIPIAAGGTQLRLHGARHPLLAMGPQRDALVPLDLTLGDGARLLLVSGPNMGGKTVLLKTVGLTVLLSHAAFPVPAREGSAVPEVDDVRADLGDEQSVDQGLSTFAGHLRALAAMAEHASPRVLVLADELGSGTDPEEGAALGRALLEHFAARGVWGVVTTHLGQLKHVAGEVSGMVNGSLEYDADAMRPLFRFLAGVPGASHGLELAARLGFPAQVVERATTLTPELSRTVDRLVASLHESARRLSEQEARLETAREAAEREAETHRRTTEDTRRTLSRLRAQLTNESEALLARARELWQSVRQEARRATKSTQRTEAVRDRLTEVEAGLDALQQRAAEAAGEAHEREPIDPARLVAGTRVRVAELGGVVAEVVESPDAEGRVALRRGGWSIRSHVSRLFPVGEEEGAVRADRRPAAVQWSADSETVPFEVDLRGMDVEEALRALDTGLDRATLAGLTELRIIHGLGKGVLRAAVDRHLRGHPQVARQRMGEMFEGGRGVTVANLR